MVINGKRFVVALSDRAKRERKWIIPLIVCAKGKKDRGKEDRDGPVWREEMRVEEGGRNEGGGT